MSGIELYATSSRQLRVEAPEEGDGVSLGGAVAAGIERALSEGLGAGLSHPATVEMKTALPPAKRSVRESGEVTKAKRGRGKAAARR